MLADPPFAVIEDRGAAGVVISGATHGFMVEHASTFDKVVLEILGLAERAYRSRVAEETQLDEALAG